ncbi:Late embryogenesis abundant protein, LEA_2 subgroup [Dillenia turbinata]|uniref:Late embryogenesis abundant protein, LEA_2 subgroup n=1 Tax=Dillenia turbinata TaxID=194707 RepID=A0AAN8Z1K4_9MAGN
MSRGKTSCKSLKICCAVSAILFLIIAVVIVVLLFTLFKPKQPKVTAQPVTIKGFNSIVWPLISLNVTLGIAVTVDNPNYGSFKFKDSTAYINYRGTIVGQASIAADTIPARGKHNMSTFADVFVDELITSGDFRTDFLSGVVNFTSTTTLHGKVSVLKLIKAKATSYSTCDISVNVVTITSDSVCTSKVKF